MDKTSLLSQANKIRNATELHENSAERVGKLLVDIIESIGDVAALAQLVDRFSVRLEALTGYFTPVDDLENPVPFTDAVALRANRGLFSHHYISTKGMSDGGSGGGMDEELLAGYLKEHGYVTAGDIPSLSGYATEQWVLGKGYLTAAALDGYATRDWVTGRGYALDSALKAHVADSTVHVTAAERLRWNTAANSLDSILGADSDTIINKWDEVVAFLDTYTEADTLANLLSHKVDKRDGYGLSKNDFTDTLLQKLNGIEAGANKYVLPVAKAAVLGGVMIGSSLSASATGVLDLPELHAVAGTHCKVAYDRYGRVTGGSDLAEGDIPALSISKITGLQTALDEKLDKAVFDDLFEKVKQDNGTWAIRAKYGLFSNEFIATRGASDDSGAAGGGIDVTFLEDYLAGKSYATESWVSDKLVNYYTKAESDNRFQPKGNYLTQHQDISHLLSKTDAATLYQPKGNYLTSITKAMVENVLTGTISTHTHDRIVTRGRVSAALKKADLLTGLSMQEGYGDTAYGVSYCNVINVKGANAQGASQLVLEWSGGQTESSATANMASMRLRSCRDNMTDWTPWRVVAFTDNTYTKAEADGRYVDLSSNQSVGGTKTFTATVAGNYGFRSDGATDRLPWFEWHIPGVNYTKAMMTSDGMVHFVNGADSVPTSYHAVKALSFIRQGGTSAQFLKADGSVDSNSYALTSALGSYVKKAGDTMTGGLVIENANLPLLTLKRLTAGGGAFVDYQASNQASTWWRVGQSGNADNFVFEYHSDTSFLIGMTLTHKGQLQLAAAQGTAPLAVSSNTVVANLNADLLDGVHNGYLTANRLSNRAYISDLNSPSWNTLGLTYCLFNNTAQNAPTKVDNANGVLNISAGTHGTSGEYGGQLAFHNNGRLYWRGWSAGTPSKWHTIAYLEEVLTSAQLPNSTDIAAFTDSGFFWTATDSDSATLTNSPFATTFAMITQTCYNSGTDLRRSRVAWDSYGAMKVFDDRSIAGTPGTWYDVLTGKNYSSILDKRYVTKDDLAKMFTIVTEGGKSSIKAMMGLWSADWIATKGQSDSSGTSGAGIDVTFLESYLKGDNADKAVYATQSWVNSQGFLKSHQSLANYVTLNTVQTISANKMFGGQILKQATNISWWNARDYALIRLTSHYGYSAIASLKTADGSWEQGVHTGNKMHFTYIADANYNIGNNTVGGQVSLLPDGGIEASKFIKSGGTSTQALMADGSVRAVHTLSEVTNLGWSGTSGQLATINTLAYWDGAYQGVGSNLRYCDRGRFGTMATANKTDYVRALCDADVLSGDMNEMLSNRAFIGSINATANAPHGGGWYNVIQLPHRNGSGDGSSYVGQIALGMTVNHEQMYFRTHRTRTWQHVLTEGNYESILNNLYYTETEVNSLVGAKVSKAGDTMTGDLLFSNSGTGIRQIRFTMGDNDFSRIAVGATASNAGWMEIATADDGTEPIYVRQYSGTYTSIVRTATLLDGSGNTAFPGRVNASYFTANSTTLCTNLNADLLDGRHSNGFSWRKSIGMQSDTHGAYVLLCPAYDGTLLDGGFFYGTVYITRGNAQAFNAKTAVMVQCGGQYNANLAKYQVLSASVSILGLFKVKYNGTAYIALKMAPTSIMNFAVEGMWGGNSDPMVVNSDGAGVTEEAALSTTPQIASNAQSATRLQGTYKLWGRDFYGNDVDGAMTINYTGETGIALYRKEAGSGAFIRFYNANQTANYFRMGMFGDNRFGIGYNSGTDAINILTNGNVGIGTTAPAYKLDVNGDTITRGWLRTTGQHGWFNETYRGGWYMTDENWIRNYNNKSLYMNTATIRTDGRIEVGSSGEKFLVDKDGNVTSTASMKVVKSAAVKNVLIDGDVSVWGNSTLKVGWSNAFPTDVDIYFGKHTAFNGNVFFNGSSTKGLQLSAGADFIGFFYQNNRSYQSDLMRLRYDGTVEIPGNLRLEGADAYGNRLNFGDGDYVYLEETEDDELHIYANNGIYLDANGGSVELKNDTELYFQGIGSLSPNAAVKAIRCSCGFYSDKFISTKGTADLSDMRLKRVLAPMELRVEDIAAAPLFIHEWRNDPGSRALGSSAQYWEGYVPEAVHRLGNYRTMEYDKLGVAMGVSLSRRLLNVEARHSRWLEKHETRVQRLERRVRELEKELETLKQNNHAA